MNVSGRFSVDSGAPEARGVCDRCGFTFRHRDLQWQWQWQGPKLQNRRLLVDAGCLDVPQQQLRTIILPADPLPILNPRQENYTNDDNPISPLGTSVGTLTGFSGLDAAFNMGTNKSFIFSAGLPVSLAGYNNSVGRNWGTGLTQTLAGFSLYAPNDAKMMPAGTAYKIQGSPAGSGLVWIDLYASTIAGTVGEVITATAANSIPFQYHRVVFNGDGVSQVAVAQFVINSANQLPQGDT